MLSQEQVINKVLHDRDYSLISLNNLNAEFFYGYRTEFNFIKNHFEKYHVVPDVDTFSDMFPEFEVKPVSEPATYLIEKLTEDYNQAYLRSHYNQVRELLESSQDSSEVYSFIKEMMNGMRSTSSIQCTDLWTNTHRYELYNERLSGKLMPYLGTGFEELDNVIGGIDPLEENAVIVARTGVGKSWILIRLAVALAMQNKTVGIYSGEMSADKVGYRVDTLMARALSEKGITLTLHNKELNRGQDFKGTADSYRRYMQAIRNTDNIGHIRVLTKPDIVGPATVDALGAFVDKEKLDVLLIDQYSLLDDSSKKFKSPYEAVANISKEVKNLQVMKKIPIISVAQLNREGQGQRDSNGKKVKAEFGTEQIGLSDRIGQDATLVLALDKTPILDMEGNFTGEYELSIKPTKSRDGGEGDALVYKTDLDVGEFTFIPKSEDKFSAGAKANAKAMRDEYGAEDLIF